MANELYDIRNVKNEYLEKKAQELQQTLSTMQLEIVAYVLDDFCNEVIISDLAFIRVDPSSVAVEVLDQPQAQSFDENPFVSAPMQNIPTPQAPRAQPVQPAPVYRAPVQPVQPLRTTAQAPQKNIDVTPDKAPNFADKIKAMRIAKKPDKINPEDY